MGKRPYKIIARNGLSGSSSSVASSAALEPMVYRLLASPLSIDGTEDAAAMTTMTDAIAQRAGSDIKVTPVYTGRETWAAAYGTAVYDPQGDIYQLFYLN